MRYVEDSDRWPDPWEFWTLVACWVGIAGMLIFAFSGD